MKSAAAAIPIRSGTCGNAEPAGSAAGGAQNAAATPLAASTTQVKAGARASIASVAAKAKSSTAP